jgi:zinc protease
VSAREPHPTVLVESSQAVPLCGIAVMARTGTAEDPDGREGLVRHAAELMRRGAGRHDRAGLDEALDELGASIDVVSGADSIGFTAQCLARHVDRVVDLLDDVLARPRFDEGEHEKLRRETLATLDELRDDDASLCARYFDRAAFGAHPYARTTLGTTASLAALGRDEVAAWAGRRVVPAQLIFGFSGAIEPARAEAIAARLSASLSARAHLGGGAPQAGPPTPPTIDAPAGGGRRTVLVDKPERTQSQILVGHVAPPRAHADWLPLSVGAAIFGGTFTSRLMTEVRVKRGWSYGASSRIGRGRHGAAFRLKVFPSAELTCDTLRLVLEQFEAIVDGGVTQEEVDFALGYLAGSWPFELVTPGDRLGKQLDTLLLGLPADTYPRHLEKLRAIDAHQVNAAIRRWWRPRDCTITVVATADDLRADLEQLPIGPVDVVDWEAY